MDYNKEQLVDIYNRLPNDVKEAVADVNTEQTIINIGERRNLHIDQIGELADETGLVMLGLTPVNQFVDHLEQRLQIDRHTAENISLDINAEIFLKIRESLRQLSDAKEEGAPAREEIIHQVENPVKTANVFEEKMGKMFNLPRVEIAPPSPPTKTDPYLEPVE